MWEKAIIFACLKVTGEIDKHVYTSDDKYNLAEKPRFANDSAAKFNEKLNTFLAANP